VYGTLATTGKTGLGAADNSRIGSSNNYAQIADNGGIISQGGGPDDLDATSGNYNGNGLPTVQAAGVHHDTKIKTDATLNANYKIGSIDVVADYQLISPGYSYPAASRIRARSVPCIIQHSGKKRMLLILPNWIHHQPLSWALMS
jgi:hypothetical protein